MYTCEQVSLCLCASVPLYAQLSSAPFCAPTTFPSCQVLKSCFIVTEPISRMCTAVDAPTSTPASNPRGEMDALLTRLPTLDSRVACDELAVAFCYINSKAARRRLVGTQFAILLTRLRACESELTQIRPAVKLPVATLKRVVCHGYGIYFLDAYVGRPLKPSSPPTANAYTVTSMAGTAYAAGITAGACAGRGRGPRTTAAATLCAH